MLAEILQANDDLDYETIPQYAFPEETIISLSDLGDVLREIQERLIAEGYSIIDGQLKKLDTIKF